jgi:hypothetical protein
VSYIAIDAHVGQPKAGHVWRSDNGQIHATVYVSEKNSTAFFFTSAADARAMAERCTEAAEAMEALAAEDGKEAGDE